VNPVTRLPAAAAALAAVVASAPAVRAQDAPRPDFEKALYEVAPKLLERLKEKQYKTVGVLKFHVTTDGGQTFTDKAGPINLRVARSLEIALVLRMTGADSEKVRLLRNASEVAAGVRGASHLTPAGRAKLFSARYPTAWGGDTAEADAFLTGVVQVAPDRRSMKVKVLAFDRSGMQLKPLLTREDWKDDKKQLLEEGWIVARLRLTDLIDSGQNFDLRGMVHEDGSFKVVDRDVSDKPAAATTEAIARTADVRPTAPLQSSPPVELDILYDGQKQPVEFKNNQAFVNEPNEGQKVEFVLRRKDNASGDKYGVVLKVNGINTLYEQRLPADQCKRWVLEKGDPDILVKGFYYSRDGRQDSGDLDFKAFRVSSQAESQTNEVNYGSDAGQISFTIFRASADGPPTAGPVGVAAAPKEEPKSPSEAREAKKEAVDVAAATRASLPNKAPDSFGDLKDALRGDALRGLIEMERGYGGSETVQVVGFPNPTMVLNQTIIYRPKLPQ
jgi:hypothetical protein